MTFARSVFAFALLMLLLGAVGSRFIVAHLFAEAPISTVPPVAALHPTATASPTETPRATATVATATPQPTAAVTSTATVRPTIVQPAPTGTPVPVARSKTRTQRVVAPTALPTIRPLPTPSPTPGIVTLARYWVNSLQAQPGQTIAIGYVIDNATGQTERIMLGASLKSARSPNWATGALSDPAHDVVGVVPPGVTTHTRFFTLPSRLRPGTYDVAWGLRNAVTGARLALVAAPSVLHVGR